MKKIFFTLALISSFLLGANADNHTVTAGMFYYAPESLTISVGDTVTWINDGGTHDVNANTNTITGQSFNNPESFGSPYVSGIGDVIYTHVFTIEGTYDYDCSYGNHAAAGMVAQIIVEPLPNPSIMEIVEASENHTYLETAINTANLNETLDTGGPFTLFAPTDEAFTALEVAQPGFIAALLADTETLTSILFYHVVSGITMAEDLNDGDLIPTLNTASLTVSIDGMTYMINMATVTTPNLEASNGVVHVIDMVLVPAEEPGLPTIMEIVEASENHTYLETAINTANLNETLDTGGPFTLFAPTDEAFTALEVAQPGFIAALLADTETLTSILFYHVVSGITMAEDLNDGDLIPTLNTASLTVSIDGMTYMINMATVTTPNLEASNGVVHVIDMVLVPAEEPNDSSTVMDIIENSVVHNTLEAAINEAGLAEALSGDGPFTVFAPTDEVFSELDPMVLGALLANTELLTNVLLGHVTESTLFSEDLTDGLNVTMMNDGELTVSNDGISIMLGVANVTQADFEATNGVVHFIDTILITTVLNPDTITVMDIIETSPSHNTLEAAINAAGLNETLSGDGPFTVFAPTDEAFFELPAGTVEGLLADIPALTAILKHHVHSGNVLSTGLSDGMSIPTLNDDNLIVSIDGATVMIDMATVIVADLEATNGVVHVINMVLIPADPSSIGEYNTEEIYMYSLNLLGEKVDRNTKGEVLIDIYSNGKTIKRLNLTK